MHNSPHPDVHQPRHRRQKFLCGLIRRNLDKNRPPCENLRIESLGELLWLLKKYDWQGGLVQGNRGLDRAAAWFLHARNGRDPAAFQLANLQGLIAQNLDLRWVNVEGALLQDADFRGADLSHANLCYAELAGTVLTGALLSETEFISQERASEIIAQRQRSPTSHPYDHVEIRSRNELQWIMREEHWSGELDPGKNARADLSGAIMLNVDFSGVDFIGANITDALLLDEKEIEHLQTVVAKNNADRRPPYKDVPIHERRELLWIMRENGWSGEPNPGQLKRADLRSVDLRQSQLANADLEGANLSRARVDGANLNRARLCSAALVRVTGPYARMQGADLTGARLEHSHLKSINLVGAELFGAHVTNMRMEQACLCDARLSVADIRGTDFRGADFRGADLRGAKVDAATSFIDIELDDRVHLGDIIWYGSPLTQIDWSKVSKIGDEFDIKSAVGADRSIAYRDTIRAYRGLWTALRRQGIYASASRYRLREKRLERRLWREQRKWLDWFGSLRSDLVAGYGEEPWKALVMFCLVIVVYAGIYYVVSNIPAPFISKADHSALGIIDCLKLSLTAFQGRTQSMGPVTFLLGVSETLLGAYILLAFTVLNTQKILGKPE